MRRNLITLLKILVTLLGLGFAFTQFDLSEALDTLRRAEWAKLLVVFLLVNLSLVIRAVRWWLLLEGLGARIKLTRLTALYFSGNFFNTFLPSGFGGDVVRVAEIARTVTASTAAGTVIVDRLTGLMALFLIALFALPFRPADFPDWQALIVGGLSLIGLIVGHGLLSGWLFRILDRLLPYRLSPRRIKLFDQILHAVEGCGWRAVAGAMAISALFNVILISWWMIAGQALGYSDLRLQFYALVVPILSVALLVPSIGGLGLREALAPQLFAAGGLTGTDAVSLSLLVFTLTRLSGLLGAPVYLISTLRSGQRSRKATLIRSSDPNE